MPQVSTEEFERMPLQVHSFLADRLTTYGPSICRVGVPE